MKYLLFMILTLSTFAFTEHGYISLDIVKDTNGSYTYSIPNVHTEKVNGYFIHVTDLKLNFTAPRGDWSKLDHKAIKYSNSYGLRNRDFYITFSIDILQNLTEDYDSEFGNTLKVGYWW